MPESLHKLTIRDIPACACIKICARRHMSWTEVFSPSFIFLCTILGKRRRPGLGLGPFLLHENTEALHFQNTTLLRKEKPSHQTRFPLKFWDMVHSEHSPRPLTFKVEEARHVTLHHR